jgi:hypothetical protein
MRWHCGEGIDLSTRTIERSSIPRSDYAHWMRTLQLF